jgi:murein DD-endopeptidase MepM/ murein hydrolase activator NlpD
VVAFAVALVPLAGAQQGTGGHGGAPRPEDTPSTVPGAAPAAPDPTATTVPGATTTLLPPDPLAASAEGGGSGAYAGQLPFDLSSMAVLSSEVRRASGRLRSATARLDRADSDVRRTMADFERLSAQVDVVGKAKEQQVAGAARSKTNLRRRAVEAYVRGGRPVDLVVVTDDPVEYSRARRFVEAVAGLDRAALDEYRANVAAMTTTERRLVDEQSDLERRVTALVEERRAATQAVLDARRCLRAYQFGSHVCVDGFTFPVLGEVSFWEGWGSPRLTGSADQHWHEGTDILAPNGREIVAVENGTLSKVGSAGLGGMRLWLHGDSGVDYYYAHFAAFAPGVADGLVVHAGDVVGYAGSTGDAAGGPAHLHLEIHPGGGGPVDPYPLLKAAWGDRPQFTQDEVMSRLASVAAALPPEEG